MPLRHALLAVAVAAAWGLNFVVIEVGLEGLPPLLLCALRFAALALLVPFFARPAVPWRLIAAIGLALGVAKFGLLFTGMDVGMPAGLASVVLQAQAPLTLLLAAAVLRERPTRPQVAGLACAAAGIALIGADHGGDVRIEGLVLTVAAAGAWAVANLFMKRASAADPVALIVWISLIPPLPLLALALLADGPGTVGDALGGIGARELLAIAYIAGVSTLGGFAAWSWLLRSYPAGQVASFALLVPPFGLAFGALLRGEHVGPAQVAAAALVVAGVAASTGALRGRRAGAQATRSRSARPSGPSTPASVAPSGRSYSSPLSTSTQRPAAAPGSSQP